MHKVKKTIELSPALDAQLKEFAQATGVTSSTIIRLALMNFLPQNKLGGHYGSK